MYLLNENDNHDCIYFLNLDKNYKSSITRIKQLPYKYIYFNKNLKRKRELKNIGKYYIRTDPDYN